MASAASMLDDELERLRLEVASVLIAPLTVDRAASTLDEELERLRLEL